MWRHIGLPARFGRAHLSRRFKNRQIVRTAGAPLDGTAVSNCDINFSLEGGMMHMVAQKPQQQSAAVARIPRSCWGALLDRHACPMPPDSGCDVPLRRYTDVFLQNIVKFQDIIRTIEGKSPAAA